MATRSTIAIQKPDGKILSIYSHWDGYPSNNGKLLLEHYNSFEKAEELVALGGISSLSKFVKPNLPEHQNHSFENKHEDVTVAYHRDRGEELQIAEHKDLADYTRNGDFQQYAYLFKDGKWFLQRNNEWVVLTKEMCKEG